MGTVTVAVAQSHPVPPDPVDEEAVMTTTKTYTVTGMTCSHCVGSVSTEVGRLPGVSDVQVDLVTGAVTVTSDQPVDDEAVAAAVDEAGYEVAK
jgi:copper ion binding protein